MGDLIRIATISQALPAGATKFNIPGSNFRLMEAPNACEVEFYRNGVSIGVVGNFLPGLATEGVPFDAVYVTPGVADDTVVFVISDSPVRYDNGQAYITNTVAQAIPVLIENTVGVPANVQIVNPITLTATSVDINNTTASPVNVRTKLADTLADTGLVAATDVRAALLAADATRRGFRVRNAGPDPVAIGGAAVAFATAAIIIQAGETWNENEAPGAAWKSICAAGKTASLYVLEVKQ